MSLRVLHVDSELTWRGGEQQLVYLMQGLRQQRIPNFLSCPARSALYRQAQRFNLTVFPIPMRGELDLFSAIRLAQLINNLKINILHCHSGHAHAIGFISTMFTKKCSLVVTRRVDFYTGKNVLSRIKYGAKIDKIIAVSSGVKNVLIEDRIAAGKITVVHDGIDLRYFQGCPKERYLYQEFGIDDRTPVVGNVAALAPHKHQQNLLAAAKIVLQEIPAVRFLIVGEGELKEELKELARELGIEQKVFFTGFRDDVPQILSILDLFVVSSYLEGLGSSTLEAMAAGLPVVATRTGGIPEIVQDGVNGLLVPPRDSRELAAAMITLLRDENKRRNMGIAGKKIVENFSVEKMVEGNIHVYEQVVENKNYR